MFNRQRELEAKLILLASKKNITDENLAECKLAIRELKQLTPSLAKFTKIWHNVLFAFPHQFVGVDRRPFYLLQKEFIEQEIDIDLETGLSGPAIKKNHPPLIQHSSLIITVLHFY